MRHSRRATLASGGVLWDKYEYNYILTKDLVGYNVHVASLDSDEWNGLGGYFNGYQECDIVLKKGKYYDHYEYELSDYDQVLPESDGDVVQLWVYGDNAFSVKEANMTAVGDDLTTEVDLRTIVNNYKNERYEWRVEDYVGVVRGKEGKYPDAGCGYTFVKTDGDYTIMTDGEKYYAYKLRG